MALVIVAQLVMSHAPKVAGSILVQGTCPGFGFRCRPKIKKHILKYSTQKIICFLAYVT